VWIPAPSRNYLSARLSFDASTPSNSGLPTGYGGFGHLRGKEHLYKVALLHYTDSGQANQFAKSCPTSIQGDLTYLRQKVASHGNAIVNRWKKKRPEERRAILLQAFPKIHEKLWILIHAKYGIHGWQELRQLRECLLVPDTGKLCPVMLIKLINGISAHISLTKSTRLVLLIINIFKELAYTNSLKTSRQDSPYQISKFFPFSIRNCFCFAHSPVVRLYVKYNPVYLLRSLMFTPCAKHYNNILPRSQNLSFKLRLSIFTHYP